MTQGDLEPMFRSLKKAVIERAMSAEMSEHLGYGHGESMPEGQADLPPVRWTPYSKRTRSSLWPSPRPRRDIRVSFGRSC